MYSAQVVPGQKIEGQVCDRCRQKKIKCDGATPQCSNCTSTGVQCEVSAKLRRKTKIRGYTPSSTIQADLEKLELENATLKQQLQNEVDKSRELQQQRDRIQEQLNVASRPNKFRKLTDQHETGAHSPRLSLSGESERSSQNPTAFVIKHMGRMVSDQANIGRFAGSTTGVHFVSSVEALCRRLFPELKAFPEDCFRLHLVQSALFQDALVELNHKTVYGWEPSSHSLRSLLDQPAEHYIQQLRVFQNHWSALCPIVPPAKYARDVQEALAHMQSVVDLPNNFWSSIQTMTMILLLNQVSFAEYDELEDHEIEQIRKLLLLSCQLHHLVIARADIDSLQATILFSVCLQITGQTAWMIQVNGVQVRLAQSLGMHRHARRFRFAESEIELRKRMWWWVYCFDKLTSIVHGLPQLISDTDVDNDLPIDCELSDIDDNGLLHPLPGEPTPVSIFIHYIKLCKILSSILSQLYTTSQRRGGQEKIMSLDRDLRVWYQNLTHALQMSGDVSDTDKLLQKSRWQRFTENECSMIAWLDLMANYALILIHRPALTFDSSTKCFRESLDICLKSCSTIILLSSSSTKHERAIGFVPFGSAVIFQCALMHVYYQCNYDGDGRIGPHSEAIVHKSIDLIRILDAAYKKKGSAESPATPVLGLLESLSAAFLKSASTERSPATVPFLSQGNHGHLGSSILMPHSIRDESTDADVWATSALESLNHLDVFDGNWNDVDQFGWYNA